jgi:thiol-disulfide isomerase/thioredoxin
MKIGKKSILIIGILILFVSSYYLYIFILKPEETPVPGFDVGNSLIDLEIPNIYGGVLKLSELSGDLIIIDFMAPWCPPCKEQFKAFKQLDPEEVTIVTVNVDPRYNHSSLRIFAEDEGVTWFFGHLPEAALTYEVSAIPVVIIADTKDVIRYRGFYTPIDKLQSMIDQYQ